LLSFDLNGSSNSSNKTTGMARVYTDFYKPNSEVDIPIRWCAPEMLRQGNVTSKSDVFSFGVCMWEILEMYFTPTNFSFSSFLNLLI